MKKSEKIIFEKDYSGESIVDLERDIYDSLVIKDVPCDEFGFHKGTFQYADHLDTELSAQDPA